MRQDTAAAHFQPSAAGHAFGNLLSLILGYRRLDVLVEAPFWRIGVFSQDIRDLDASPLEFLFDNKLLGQ